MLFKKLVLNNFSALKAGSLELTMPDGEQRRFGGLFKGLKAQIRVLDDAFWRRCVLFGPIGFAESYMDGQWETPDLVKVVALFVLNSEENSAMRTASSSGSGPFNLFNTYNSLVHRRRNNSIRKAKKNIRDHYDLSNDFFRLWLDPTMTYSAGWFDPPNLSLEEAQQKKYDQLCRKLQLHPRDHLLEIGSGWGGMSMHAAKEFGCRVTTVTISEEQFCEAGQRIEAAGLSSRVDLQLLDYRQVRGQFDKIVSIEMLEAVGDRYLEDFFEQCHELLKPEGLLGLQVITCPDRQFPILRDGVDFIQKHIFPGSLLLSQRRLNEAIFQTGDLNLFDWDDMGMFYARTLQLWREAFEKRVEEVREQGFDEVFIRKWRYYLAYCEAAFATRHISVVQTIHTRPNNHSLESSCYRFFDRP